MKSVAMLLVLVIAPMIVSAQTQTKFHPQVFFGPAASLPPTGQAAAALTGGAAGIVPVGKKFIFRPVLGLGRTFPDASKPAFQVQTLGLVGVKFNHRICGLVGGGETFLFPSGKPSLQLPTFAAATAITLSKHLVLLTPATHNSKGWAAGTQIAYTW